MQARGRLVSVGAYNRLYLFCCLLVDRSITGGLISVWVGGGRGAVYGTRA